MSSKHGAVQASTRSKRRRGNPRLPDQAGKRGQSIGREVVALDDLNVLTINHERRKTMDKALTRNLAICGAALAWLGASSAAIAADATPLLAKYNCAACHTVDKKLVGPSYKEVAAKYAGDSGAAAKLEQKVKAGGTGVWGQIPMPPNNVPDADLKTLVEWILTQK
jgi:cytochrome c